MHATLTANRNFQYSQACPPPPSEGAGTGPTPPHKHVWRAEIVALSADGVGTKEDLAPDEPVEDLYVALAETLHGGRLRASRTIRHVPRASQRWPRRSPNAS
jgi:hypothetical protein